MVDSFFFVAFTTLLTIVNPLGALLPFLALTTDHQNPERRRIAQRAAFVAGATLVVCAAVGALIFKFYGITLPAMRLAGGILILLVAIDMLHAKQSRTKGSVEETQEAQNKEDAAIFPIAIPLLSGPGAMLSTFVLMDKANTMVRQASVYLSIVLVMLTSYIVLSQAHRLAHLMGRIGINIMSRLMGLMLASVAMQFIIDGLTSALPGLAK